MTTGTDVQVAWAKGRLRVSAALPGLCAAGAMVVGAAAFAWLSMRHNDGHLIYALDDAYIHTALAKNLSQHGVWGVTPYEFSSCSSSLLWTLLLAGVYPLTGPNEWAPFILALASGLLLLAVTDRIPRTFALPPWPRLGGLVLCIPAMPVPALVTAGTEHVRHGTLPLAFAYLVAREVSPPGAGARACDHVTERLEVAFGWCLHSRSEEDRTSAGSHAE